MPIEATRSKVRRTIGVRTKLLVSVTVALSAFAVPITSLLATTSAKASSLQQSSDGSATGWYPNEPGLSPAKVKSGDFGELFATQVNGDIFAQPLVSQSTVLAVTENNYAYGLNSITGAIEWQDNFGPVANPEVQIGCLAVGQTLGITGTPVIDPSTDIAYFVAAKDTGTNGATQWFMEAVNVQSGDPAPGWPADGVPIQGSADGDPGTVFNGQYELQRPGLVLVNGVVYATFGSMCDVGSWEGWLVGVSESSARITTMWSTEEDVPDTGAKQPAGGIWQSGSPPVVNSEGDIFVATGNGDDPTGPLPGNDPNANTYGEAVIELSTSGGILHPIDFFIAADADALNARDGDLGSGGLAALPASMGTKQEPNVLLIDGKQGILYVLNQDKLGGYQEGAKGTDDVPSEVGPYGGVWAKPAVWPGNGGYVYIPTAGTAGFAANGGSLNAFKRTVKANGTVSFALAGATANSGNVFGFGSSSPIVTSNGAKSGSALVWIIHDVSESGADSQLQAYDPIPVKNSLEEVWSSAPFYSSRFAQPGVDNGIVYVGTGDERLMAFGALTPKTPDLSGTDVNFPATIVSQSVTETATFTAAAPTTVSSFSVTGNYYLGTPGVALGPGISLPASLSSGQSITVPITFHPATLGANLGTLTTNFTGATSTITLAGQGETPNASFTISPDEANFPPELIGGRASEPIPITFTNVSSTAINVTGFASPILPFTVTNAPANQTIQPNGGTLTFNVVFHPPSSSGDFAHVSNSVATLETSVGNFGIALSGSANPPATLSTAPDVLNFGKVAVGSSATLRFDLGDQGGFPLRIIRSTPPRTNGFIALTNPLTQLANTNPPDTIAPNTSVQETVRFSPTRNGYVTATWLLKGNDGNGVQRVTVTGTGYNP
ncbi:MAG: choice-of-anchor D domain-containing protein [Acidimicrobiales bacterium]